jgi:uncharacterized protein
MYKRSMIIMLILLMSCFYLQLCSETSKMEKQKIEELKLLAEKGDAQAQSDLAYDYYYGKGIKMNREKALQLNRLSADQGNMYGQYGLGFMYYDGVAIKKDCIEAIKWFKMAALQGNSNAQCCLGKIYKEGNGVDVNLDEAAHWMELSALQDNTEAQELLANVGWKFENTNTSDGKQKALRLYKLTAEKGGARGQYLLAMAYQNGTVVKKDLAEAAKWYKSAADLGEPNAVFRLGLCYLNGDGIEKNYKEAYFWIQLVASHSTTGFGKDIAKSIAKSLTNAEQKEVNERVKAWYQEHNKTK